MESVVIDEATKESLKSLSISEDLFITVSALSYQSAQDYMIYGEPLPWDYAKELEICLKEQGFE